MPGLDGGDDDDAFSNQKVLEKIFKHNPDDLDPIENNEPIDKDKDLDP